VRFEQSCVVLPAWQAIVEVLKVVSQIVVGAEQLVVRAKCLPYLAQSTQLRKKLETPPNDRPAVRVEMNCRKREGFWAAGSWGRIF